MRACISKPLSNAAREASYAIKVENIMFWYATFAPKLRKIPENLQSPHITIHGP